VRVRVRVRVHVRVRVRVRVCTCACVHENFLQTIYVKNKYQKSKQFDPDRCINVFMCVYVCVSVCVHVCACVWYLMCVYLKSMSKTHLNQQHVNRVRKDKSRHKSACVCTYIWQQRLSSSAINQVFFAQDPFLCRALLQDFTIIT